MARLNAGAMNYHRNRYSRSPIDWRAGVDGYIYLNRRSRNSNDIPRHIVEVERILGKPLPKGAVVHHADENPANFEPTNLILCPDQGYHNLLHRRMIAKKVCGIAWFLKCNYCKQYDHPNNIKVRPGKGSFHMTCFLEYKKHWKHRQTKKYKTLSGL